MKYRTKEKTNCTTSLLGFGCMRLPVNEDGSINEELAFKMWDTAYERGVNYYDNAWFYHDGESETVLGKWIQTKDRSTIHVVTKSPVHLLKSPEEFDEVLNKQLEKLQTDYVDFYLLHTLTKESWQQAKDFDLLSRMEAAKASGKIRRIGFSFHDDYEVFEDIVNSYDWDFCQIQLNYMDTEYQAGLKGYQLCEEKGIPMVIMEPVKGGQLANVPKEVQEVFEKVHPEWTPASWALRFVASHSNVYTVLSGMSNMEQVMDNLNTFDTFEPLNQEELDAIQKAREIFDARIQVPCTGCKYCMPCPFGINIPENFKLLNRGYVYNMVEPMKKRYEKLGDAKAEFCKQCGACMRHCPQHIQIPDKLKRVTEILGKEKA